MLHQLGKDIQDLQPISGAHIIGTAKEGTSLKVLGELKDPLILQILGTDVNLECRPAVLEGLSMPFNICGPFLKDNNIDQLHSEDSLDIAGTKVPLIATLDPPIGKCVTSRVYIENDTKILPFSVTHITALIPDIINGLMPPGDGIVMGEEEFEKKTDLHTWSGSVVTCNEKGRVTVGVMNTLPEEIIVKKGTHYGNYESVGLQQERDKELWKVNLLEKKVKIKETKKTPTTEETEEKSKKLRETFRLRESPFLQDEKDLFQAEQLLLKYYDLFSFDGSFGKTDLIQHKIRLTPDAKQPINQRYRPVNPSLEKDLREQLDKWIQHGVIEESNSPWNFGLVAAPKKNGKVRWCVDYRPLNQITVKDSHPIGNIEDNLTRLSRSKVFSAIDGSGAFHVIKLEKTDREKTAFATPWGSYHFKRMPFGLCGGPTTYARLVQLVLQGIPYQVALPYLDDTVIHSKDLKTHFQALDKVLRAHEKAGLKLQPEKCQLFMPKITYLGHEVTGEGIKPLTEYVEIVQEWPVPNTRSKLRTFLGKVGYYRRFIKDYAALAHPLTECLKQDETKDNEEFQPSKEYVQSFMILKNKLMSAPILAYPQFDSPEPFILDTDWSQENNAIGAVLSQVQEGHERVIAYGAKKLTKSQSSYPSTKGELAAAIIFIRHWKYYLQFRRFTLRIDNRALLWIQTMEAPSGMIQRWLDTLANYDFQVIHRAGRTHANADSLSRVKHQKEPTDEVDISMGEKINHLVATIEENPEWTPQLVRRLQEEDQDLQIVRPWIISKTKPDKATVTAASHIAKIYLGFFEDLYIDRNQIIRYRMPIQQAGLVTVRSVVLLPRVMWQDALNQAHLAVAHMGEQATVNRAQNHVYFPGMAKHTAELIKHCLPCQTKVGRVSDQRHTLSSHCDGYPFQKLSMDFVGPLPPSRQGNQYLLTIRDTFTRWLEAFPIRHADAKTVVRILEKEIFPRYGIADQIHSDRGTPFVSTLLQDVAKILGIRHTQTPAYNPKSNPVERAHRDLETAITALVGKNVKDWEDVLPHVLFALRTSVCRSTGLAPYQALFGRDATTPLDLIFGPPPDEAEFQSYHDYAIALRNRILAAHAWARDNMRTTIERQRRAYHKDKDNFQLQQKVWLFTPRLRPGQSKKFATYWTGPWTISKRINDLMYQIEPDPTWLRKQSEVVSVDRLKTFYATEITSQSQVQPPPVDADLTMLGDEFAEFFPQDDDDQTYPDPPPFLQPPPAPPLMPPAPQLPPQPVIPPPALPPPLALSPRRPIPPPATPSPEQMARYRQMTASPPTGPPPPSPQTGHRPLTRMQREQLQLQTQHEADQARRYDQALAREQRLLHRNMPRDGAISDEEEEVTIQREVRGAEGPGQIKEEPVEAEEEEEAVTWGDRMGELD